MVIATAMDSAYLCSVKGTLFHMQTLKTDIRKRILNVSKRLFLKKGVGETTTRDIARDAGVNLSNL